MPSIVHELPRRELKSIFQDRVWDVRIEEACQMGQRNGWADLVARRDSFSILIEVEAFDGRRVYEDLLKGENFDALWLIAPNNRVAAALRRKLSALRVVERPPYLAVYTVPQAKKAVLKLERTMFL